MSHLLDPEDAPVTPVPPRPSSPRRIAASRANGAKSRGPKTPEGKARSSRNALTHGLLANDVVLEREDPQAFADFTALLYDHFRPSNPVAEMLVDDLAAAHWRRRRIRRFESETHNIAIEEKTAVAFDVRHAEGLAVRELNDATSLPRLLRLYETRFDRQIYRLLSLLPDWNQPYEDMERDQPETHQTEENAKEQTNLVPHPDTPQPAASAIHAMPAHESRARARRTPLLAVALMLFLAATAAARIPSPVKSPEFPWTLPAKPFKLFRHTTNWPASPTMPPTHPATPRILLHHTRCAGGALLTTLYPLLTTPRAAPLTLPLNPQ